jgi:deazaflavin-dependent oxidoreductase (nitroreductase family)
VNLTSARSRHTLGRALRAPAAFDRRGLRFLLNRLSPAPVLVIVHRGRRSGKTYKTPVEAIARQGEEFVVSPMYGESSDWYRNVLAGGLVEIHLDGETRHVEWRRLGEDERRQAIAAYRSDHPAYSRIVLRALVRLHGFEGDPLEAVVHSIPMLALHPPR